MIWFLNLKIMIEIFVNPLVNICYETQELKDKYWFNISLLSKANTILKIVKNRNDQIGICEVSSL